jgi:hypothetical protein
MVRRAVQSWTHCGNVNFLLVHGYAVTRCPACHTRKSLASAVLLLNSGKLRYFPAAAPNFCLISNVLRLKAHSVWLKRRQTPSCAAHQPGRTLWAFLLMSFWLFVLFIILISLSLLAPMPAYPRPYFAI